MENQQLAQIFKTPDSSTILELLLIVIGAGLLIITTQKLLPWVANRLHGKPRFFLLAMVPLLRLFFIVASILLVVPRVIEPSLQNMIAVLGSLGLALGFALKDYAASLIAGVVAVGERPYRNGDWIEINGIYGEVSHVGIRTLQLVTPDDTVVTIPHLKLWNQAIANANNGTPKLQCAADFYLHPDHDASQVEQLLLDVALTSPYLRYDEPVAVVVQEHPWGTRYRLKAYPIDPRQQFRFISDLTVRGKEELRALGVAFSLVSATKSGTGQIYHENNLP
ncbi:mechanosensitive ion channel family protein [Methylomarinum vadi]|uniref:mechanosensitive ion channel family protein n=1 Tax=Methylomarinum vadi TaxID=438855 RepID=UPI0004DED8A4|nr:mechanosensitive ion channel domain-containing protein [Methylomarinum vadi]